jgi:hypothetical protein
MVSRTVTKTRVFISATTQDGDWARQLDEELRHLGVPTFLDVQQREYDDDDDREERTRRALKQSSHVVFVVSRGVADSPFLAFELGAALAGRKEILSVVAEDVPQDEIFESLARRRVLPKRDPAEVAREIAEAIGK